MRVRLRVEQIAIQNDCAPPLTRLQERGLRNDYRDGTGRGACNTGSVDTLYFVIVGNPGLNSCIDVGRLSIYG